ncbi:xanthine dehydrogenase accessory protein XdhC [Roseobacter denitrificans]|uniref:Xanthine dehydrogenase accessory factor n=1 Tax=Roseobacter denitrificans (strain ATCC 33942 / OCh 114) TaxID=375451 RepID=Q160S9_ROSDO|nr:xanthine dehydrogenase accessory protein XdhC [Roseobacter denitrificans]ABG33514.1 xanthine dehydrogenase accessory factor [Roseobacter denitrificans OCh 114]AVL52829.1 xanthine dehydrogenase accessory protein XdhC [Roseobacter denitrificans]SFG04909.1 molybdenum cofactor sulfurylase [Roseobacter denitrificans OCh 114]
MSFDRSALIDACRHHGLVTRVVVARVRGSAPREVGAAVLVWRAGASGTIGGGALEHALMAAARDIATPGYFNITRHALGPDMGQCCGGSVDIVTESFDLAAAEALPEDVIARGPGDMPLPVARIKTTARNTGVLPEPALVSGWMVEPVTTPTRDIWIWGAGHVGRALISVLAPLPGVRLTWVDVTADRFPDHIPDTVTTLTAARPERLVAYAPQQAEHIIVTFSHDLDLELCHRLLHHGFRTTGLIGSATKWARFKSRLKGLGHSGASIDRITCPIGDPSLGKHPHVIALGVAADLLRTAARAAHLEGYA